MTVISFIFSFGLTIINSVNSGLKNFYINNITGDYLVMSRSEEPMTIFGALNPIIDDFIEIPVLPNYKLIEEKLSTLPYVESITKQITGSAVLKIGKRHYPVPFFGIDSDTYFDFFKGVTIVEGSSLVSEENGILLNINQKERYERDNGKPVSIGAPLLLTIFGNSGFKIREVILKGYYTYSDGSDNLSQIVLVDPGTARKLTSIFETQEVVDVVEGATDLLSGDWDEMFSEVAVDNSSGSESDSLLDSLFNEKTENVDNSTVSGSWNFLMLRVSDSTTKKQIVKDLNKYSDTIIVSGWKQSAGQAATLGSLMLFFFIGGFILVAFAGGVGIINVITLSVINRTGEIGTIRSLGAQKSFVFKMILTEVLIITTIGTIIGSIIGIGSIYLINSLYISLPGQLLKSIFGGEVLYINFSYILLLLTSAFSIVFGILSAVYPLKQGVSISPIQAINKV